MTYTPRKPAQPDTAAVLARLGCTPGQADERTAARAQNACAQILDAAAPRAVWRVLAISTIAHIIKGSDIARHLQNCTSCALLAVTLGAQVDALLRRASAADMSRAVFLDAAASVLIEQEADDAEKALRREESQTLYMTGRFSPGYGDFPIEVQGEVLHLLDAPRKIGLCATQSHLLTPTKSITALCGLSAAPVTGRLADCTHCVRRDICELRKGGKTCG